MSREARRRRVADLITRTLVEVIHEEVNVNPRVYAHPNKGKIWIEAEGERFEYEDVRFCCPGHCWSDIEREAATQMLDLIGYQLIKIIKLYDHPEF